MLFIGSSNELEEFRAGTSAAWLGVVGGWMLAFRTLRTVDRFEEAAAATPPGR